MHFVTDIKIAANKLIFGRGKGKKNYDPYECADHVNRSYNYLWKICDINTDHPIPLEIIVPLMNLKNNYELLELVCWACGDVFIKLPKGQIKKGDGLDIAADYSVLASEVSALVTRAFQDSDSEIMTECLNKLKTMTSETVSMHKTIEKKASKQLSLELA
jgi:hypothetical protein